MPVMANEPIILNVYDMVSGKVDPGEESLKIVCFLSCQQCQDGMPNSIIK